MPSEEIIAVDDKLYRRVLRRYVLEAQHRISSAAFKDKKGKKPDEEPSVDLARLTTPVDCRERGGRTDLCVASLLAAVPIELGMPVKHDPYPKQEPDNYAHTLIKQNDSMTKCELMARRLQLELMNKQAS